ncbi:hypothetical protein ACO0QE_003526 [Hanseniaspora vineae]
MTSGKIINCKFWLASLNREEENFYGQCDILQYTPQEIVEHLADIRETEKFNKVYSGQEDFQQTFENYKKGNIKQETDSNHHENNDSNFVIKNLIIGNGKNYYFADWLSSLMIQSNSLVSRDIAWSSLLYWLSSGSVGSRLNTSGSTGKAQWMIQLDEEAADITGEKNDRDNVGTLMLIDASTKFKKIFSSCSVLSTSDSNHFLNVQHLTTEIVRTSFAELDTCKRNLKELEDDQKLRESLTADLDAKREERDTKTLSLFLKMLNSKKKEVWQLEKQSAYYKKLLEENNISFANDEEGSNTDVSDISVENVSVSEEEDDETTPEDENLEDVQINQYANTTTNDKGAERVKYNKADPFLMG